VAAICGATAGVARGGLLDERTHTSASAEYLAEGQEPTMAERCIGYVLEHRPEA
jgi:putative intracellular protease/amidase